MQLPGMSTQPVRVVLEVTWWPATDDWSIARKGWRRDRDNIWQLEEMSCSGTPLNHFELTAALNEATAVLVTEIEEASDPFSTVGAFR